MLQALLADRFKLATHRGKKEDEVYALVVAKSGLKVKQADGPALAAAADSNAPDARGRTITRSSPSMGTVRQTDSPDHTFRWEAPGTTLEGLAEVLDPVGLLLPVVDMTGLKGRYPVVLEASLHDAFALAALRADLTAASSGGPPGVSDPAATEDAQRDMQNAMVKGLNNGLLELGLQLERRKGPVEILVVDHAEKIPTGN